MTTAACAVAAVCLGAVASCAPPDPDEPDAGGGETPVTPAPAGAARDWNAVIEVVVRRLALAPGERVFAAGRPDLFAELPGTLARAVEAAGGVYVGTLGVDGPYGPDGTEAFATAATGLDREGLRELLRDVPVGVMLPGASGSDPAYAAMVDLLREGLGVHRAVHFHWGGAYPIEDLSVPVPAEALAYPTVDSAADAMYRRAITAVDYEALEAAQTAFERAARAGEVHVTTPAGTDLRFRIGDRPVNRQDGDASAARTGRSRILIDREIEFPAGVLRVAPLETTVEGVIAFPRSEWNGGGVVEDLLLTIEAGRITGVQAGSGVEHARTELEGAGEAAAFRELGVGFNPLLAVPRDDPWLPYFGYGSGVVRLSLGDNSELGGNVGGGWIKWVFVLDATVEVDGVRWVEDGRAVR